MGHTVTLRHDIIGENVFSPVGKSYHKLLSDNINLAQIYIFVFLVSYCSTSLVRIEMYL